jgi:hypothetical protein
MSLPSRTAQATAAVHEGWNHLHSQSPLAARGSWLRALRIDADSRAAQRALSRLDTAPDLPAAARIAYRFRHPDHPDLRAAWDARILPAASARLADLADLFGRLVGDHPTDSAAWYNRALCLAWSARNREAVSALERVVNLDAERAGDQAVSAWTLAEILRHGASAEELADDLRFACTIPWETDATAALLKEFPEIVRLTVPPAPGVVPEQSRHIEVYEWLDRPQITDPEGARAPDLPVVLATVYIGAQVLRLSSPCARGLEHVQEMLLARLQRDGPPMRREASPLPLAFLDADVWRFRIPPGACAETSDRLCREAIERYFENEWIHKRRHGLDGLTALEAAKNAGHGDPVARVKLAAVVGLREQLAERKSAVKLYHGYPFDRLRRRLGLDLVNPEWVDGEDLSCARPEQLDNLRPETLDHARLLEAAASAAGLQDDERTTRFGSELINRELDGLPMADLTAIASSLVRQAMARRAFNDALEWIDRTRALAREATARTLDIWRAEVFARSGRPQEALAVYLGLITRDGAGAALALDAALTMIDNGHGGQARTLLHAARELANSSGNPWIERRAQELLARD